VFALCLCLLCGLSFLCVCSVLCQIQKVIRNHSSRCVCCDSCLLCFVFGSASKHVCCVCSGLCLLSVLCLLFVFFLILIILIVFAVVVFAVFALCLLCVALRCGSGVICV
jgi:hypothetical protein